MQLVICSLTNISECLINGANDYYPFVIITVVVSRSAWRRVRGTPASDVTVAIVDNPFGDLLRLRDHAAIEEDLQVQLEGGSPLAVRILLVLPTGITGKVNVQLPGLVKNPLCISVFVEAGPLREKPAIPAPIQSVLVDLSVFVVVGRIAVVNDTVHIIVHPGEPGRAVGTHTTARSDRTGRISSRIIINTQRYSHRQSPTATKRSQTRVVSCTTRVESRVVRKDSRHAHLQRRVVSRDIPRLLLSK